MSEPNGLYYMRARYYDPSIWRFISEDPGSGYASVISGSVASGNIGPADILAAGIELGINSYVQGGSDTAKGIFASTVAGQIFGPVGAGAGFVGSSTSAFMSGVLSRGAKP